MIFDGDIDQLGAYTREIANWMGLRDWTINLALKRADDDSDTCATQSVPWGTQRVDIAIMPEWPSWTPDDLRVTLVHELVHCHLIRMMWTVNSFAVRLASSETIESLVRDAFLTDMECAVESVATAWAETLPLPVRETEDEAA